VKRRELVLPRKALTPCSGYKRDLEELRVVSFDLSQSSSLERSTAHGRGQFLPTHPISPSQFIDEKRSAASLFTSLRSASVAFGLCVIAVTSCTAHTPCGASGGDGWCGSFCGGGCWSSCQHPTIFTITTAGVQVVFMGMRSKEGGWVNGNSWNDRRASSIKPKRIWT